ncbi:vanadium-dependent haloperoxidase [Lacihabitans sp. CCS-44]|uniref:vanadium-dependent haloperoxidase n=1 Tax=Lacihabitans sp. CCS-44 TaxID=2487331 RepID=UPI0020CE22BB|nr:vanadium-dependent haloperoxidase [Lacihabitans sp. CCS-44]
MIRIFTTIYYLTAIKHDWMKNSIVVFVFIFSSFVASAKVPKGLEVSIKWADITLFILKNTHGGSPTFNSRFLGYAGLTMYESVRGLDKTQKSLVGKLNGLETLPQTPDKVKINYILALNAGQAVIIKSIYGFTSNQNISKIDSLEKSLFQQYSKGFSEKENLASVAYGRAIASAIFEWSKTDGGHEGYKRNFDSSFVVIRDAGKWAPPVKGQSEIPMPLHPYWGKNRTFANTNFTLPIPEMIAFDYHKGSAYHNYMLEVFNTRKTLTQEQKEIANWWGDDPSETFSPPGHSYYMAKVAVETSKADVVKASRTFASVGMAVADAFVNCWKTKYHYNAERPFMFIFYNMSTLWDLYWPEPPFPAFYSGHAGQASSAATVLTHLYGEHFAFEDKSHVGRPRDRERIVDYKARKFNSFFEAAEESAMSRLYGGIHTRHDNEVGLAEGKKIGKNINDLFNN